MNGIRPTGRGIRQTERPCGEDRRIVPPRSQDPSAQAGPKRSPVPSAPAKRPAEAARKPLVQPVTAPAGTSAPKAPTTGLGSAAATKTAATKAPAAKAVANKAAADPRAGDPTSADGAPKPMANKPSQRPLAKPAHKSGAKAGASARASSRTPAKPTERRTVDGPWEWAFDRMLERKRVADASSKLAARQEAKRGASQRKPEAGGA